MRPEVVAGNIKRMLLVHLAEVRDRPYTETGHQCQSLQRAQETRHRTLECFSKSNAIPGITLVQVVDGELGRNLQHRRSSTIPDLVWSPGSPARNRRVQDILTSSRSNPKPKFQQTPTVERQLSCSMTQKVRLRSSISIASSVQGSMFDMLQAASDLLVSILCKPRV